MIEELASELFRTISHTWHVGGRDIVPSEEDVVAVLDRAAEHLYDSPIDTRLEIGGLIIDKRSDTDYSVYLYAGEYNHQKKEEKE